MAENTERIIVPDPNQLAEKGAEMFCEIAKKSIYERGRFVVAVSGGSTPRPMHRRLSREPYLSDPFWQHTHIFWVDERMVDVDHPDSNFGTARKDLLDKIPIPREYIYPVPVIAYPKKGAERYEMTLKTFFQSIGSVDPVFDLIILGVGTDGHTGSLFPDQTSTHPLQSWVISVKGGNPNIFRLTMTYLVLNSARYILFLASGKDKAPMIKTLFEDDTADLPAKHVKPVKGTIRWLLDQEAASGLS